MLAERSRQLLELERDRTAGRERRLEQAILALRLLVGAEHRDAGAGDEAIVPANTFIATALAVALRARVASGARSPAHWRYRVAPP